MASAYVALLSLSSNIQQHEKCSHIFPEKFQIESLMQKSTFLLRFFEEHHGSQINRQEILDLEIRTKYVAIEADCMLDSHAMDQMLIKKHGYSSSWDNSSKLFPDEVIHLIIKEFESIQEKAREIIKDVEADAAQQSTLVTPIIPSSRAPVQVENSTDMVGFDKHLVTVMERITGHVSTLQILPIVGMGGIGKTTLAQSVYHNQLVKEHFHICLWATVSQSYDVQDILMSFLVDLKIVHESPQSDCHELGDKLYKGLIGRRYLIVMDDIWSAELWDKIGRFFPKNDNGSRIILTTRLLTVASDIGSCEPYKLEYLDDDESWNLLKAKLFGQNDCPPLLEDVGRRIATSCKGLPLAIVVIAGQLAKLEMTIKTWESVAQALISILHSENDSQCLNILTLSYDNLPLYLKPCFLYMAFSRQGSDIRVSDTINFWVADGLLKPHRDLCLEDSAMEYLTDLVERNFSVSKRGSTGKIKCFRVHDLLHDLSLRKSCEHKFLYSGIVDKYRTLGMETKSNGVYRIPLLKFSVRFSSFDLSSSNWANKRVHDPGADFSLWYSRLRYVQLLSAQATDISTFSVPVATTSMFQNLQTLAVKEMPGTEPIVLPPEIWEMALLGHVLIQRVVLPDPPTAETHAIGKEHCVLENLHTLSDVHGFKFSDEVLKRIPNLKKLKITYTKASDSTTEWQHYCLHNLSQFSKLESLSFSVCEMILPADISFPQSLNKLALDGCRIPWEEITMVGSLPNLEVLQLQNDAFYGRDWRPNEGEFCRLKVLHLRNMSLQQWEADSSHFPRLERLMFYNAWRLEKIPVDIGDITTLRFISIERCRLCLQSSVKQLIENQESMGNDSIQVDCTRNFILQRSHMEILNLLKLNNHPLNDTGLMIEKFENELRDLYAFLRYTAQQRNEKRLKELSEHIQEILYEYADILFSIIKQQESCNAVNNYNLRRFLCVVKEIEYVSVRVQRILLADGDYHHQELALYKDPPVMYLDLHTDDDSHNHRVRHITCRHMMDRDPDWVKKNPGWAEYVEPPVSNSRATHMFRDCALLTSVDGLSEENEAILDSPIHPGITCDYCEKEPIVGVRYRCKDCTEEGGFDLCEKCYSSGLVSDHSGLRGNKKHTSEHEFEILTSRRV